MKVGGLVPADEDNFVDEEEKWQDNEEEGRELLKRVEGLVQES